MKGFDLAKGTYTVPSGGVYLVSANVRLDNADTGYFRVAIVINGKMDPKSGLSAVKSGSIHKAYQTVNVFSAVSLNQGDVLSLQVWSSTDKSWLINVFESSFSAAFVGPLNQVQGIHAVRSYTFTSRRNPYWAWLGDWTTKGGLGTFNTNSYFSEPRGLYTAQASGKPDFEAIYPSSGTRIFVI